MQQRSVRIQTYGPIRGHRVWGGVLPIVVHPPTELEVNGCLQLFLVPAHCCRVGEVHLGDSELTAGKVNFNLNFLANKNTQY